MATTIKSRASRVVALGTGLATGLAMAGCAPVAANYGEALAYNKAVQIIDPAPVYTAEGAQPGDSGEAAVTAAQGYRERPAVQISNSGAGGGSGGGGLGGGGLGGGSGPR